MTREITTYEVSAEAHQVADAGSIPPVVERRRHKRFAVEGDAEVMVSDGIQLFRGSIADISVSGCFIATGLHLHMKPGTPVQISLQANRIKLRMTAKARSVRSRTGVGFVFETMSDYMKAELEKLIYELQGPDEGQNCSRKPPRIGPGQAESCATEDTRIKAS